jgi:hypothetical protein
MTHDVKPTRALVALAGESIWPILSWVCHYHTRQEGPAAVCLFHTAEPADSLLPAMRLRHLINVLFPDVQVVLPETFGVLAPWEIQIQIEQWLASMPDNDWVLLGSRGVTAWNLGLAGFAGSPRLQIVSQDHMGIWQRWQRPQESRGLAMEKWTELALHETDALSIETLLQSQFVTSDKIPGCVLQRGDDLPIRRLTEIGAAKGWDWPAAFKDSGVAPTGTPCDLFAQYLAAGLFELGAVNVAHGIRITPQPDNRDKETIEIDLAANFLGQFIILDAKSEEEDPDDLRQGQAILRQIQHLSGLRQQLRALAPRLVMIRPCHVFSEVERAMARACELDVVDQTDAPKLFSRLAGMLKVAPLPEPLAEIERLLVELISLRGRRRVFAPESKLSREQAALSGTAVLVDIEKHLDQLCIERGQNWVLWATRTQVFLRLSRPASPPAQMSWLIQNSLKRFGRVQVEELADGYQAVFPRSDQAVLLLCQALAGYVNRPLDPLIFIQAAPPTPPPPKKPLPRTAFSAPAGNLMDLLDNVLENTVNTPGGPKKR